MRLGIDVGGTFTDVVALGGDGRVVVGKAPSVRGGTSPVVWDLVDRLSAATGEAGDVSRALIHGTTVATNALLERSGARVALVTTAGFEDLLWLRRQDRAALYDLARDHPPPVVAREDVIGVSERIGPHAVLTALEDGEVRRVVAEVVARRPEAVAVCLLFSFRDPTHEARLADALRRALPQTPVAASHEVLPVFREYERFGTTAAEAYLRPLVAGYLERMARSVGDRGIPTFRVMASNGGTLSAAQASRRAAQLALSGPAGGVEGARLVGQALGLSDLLTLDMGGTSADASVVVNGAPLMQSAGAVGGVPLALPHVLIETVGAGGGSIIWLDAGGALRVGPESAGAEPGPACYGRGGDRPTITDAAVVLGWLDAEHPLAEDLALDPALAELALQPVARAAGLSVGRVAEGAIEVATAAMVRALRRVSVERGVDPRRVALVAFGGAGPMFACRMADALGIGRAVLPPHAGVLSALGLAAAPERIELVTSVHRAAADLDADRVTAFAELEAEARRELPGAAVARFADCRYRGQGYEVTVPVVAGHDTAAAFHAVHRERFGHADPARPVEVVNVRVVATGRTTNVVLRRERRRGGGSRVGARAEWDDLGAGARVEGPCMLDGKDATGRVEPGWVGVVHETGAVTLERA